MGFHIIFVWLNPKIKTMKRLLVLLVSGLFALNVLAQGDGFGLGVILGEPTGLSGKLWLTEKTAVDGAVAWSVYDEGALHVHADFLFHSFNLINVSKGQLPLYFGLGARVKLAGDTRIGARIPVGLDYLFDGAPLDVFLEIVPILDLVPETGFNINGAIGIRYWF
jgi:hypothetical protein